MSFQLTIDGNNAPGCSAYSVEYQPQQSDAQRNANGDLLRKCVNDKWVIKCEWDFSDPGDLVNWFNILKGLTKKDFTITFSAPTGANIAATFYISPISATMLNYSRGAVGWWKKLSCTFIEV